MAGLAVDRTVVIDNGGCTLKVGFAGEELTWYGAWEGPSYAYACASGLDVCIDHRTGTAGGDV